MNGLASWSTTRATRHEIGVQNRGHPAGNSGNEKVADPDIRLCPDMIRPSTVNGLFLGIVT
jgi:hypothetical protein